MNWWVCRRVSSRRQTCCACSHRYWKCWISIWSSALLTTSSPPSAKSWTIRAGSSVWPSMRSSWPSWIPNFSSLSPACWPPLPSFSLIKSNAQKWFGLMSWWLPLATRKDNWNLARGSCVSCWSRQTACQTSNASKESLAFPSTSKSPRFGWRREIEPRTDINASK